MAIFLFFSHNDFFKIGFYIESDRKKWFDAFPMEFVLPSVPKLITYLVHKQTSDKQTDLIHFKERKRKTGIIKGE